MVDIEADGPAPGTDLFSMIEIGAVVVEPSLDRTFYGKLKPISNLYNKDALAVTGHTREQTMQFPDPKETMRSFYDWILSITDRPMFISDNNGFDWMFVCWYFHKFCQRNPFGHSSTNLGSLYKGCCQDFRANFKVLRKTKHTHHPVDDAKGNAEAMLRIIDVYSLNMLNWKRK